MKHPRAAVTALLTTLALLLSACGAGDDVQPDPSASSFGTVRIGKGFSRETEAIAYLYAGILQDAGYSTEVVDAGSSRADYLRQMEDGTAEAPLITPDYSGNLLLELTDDGKASPRQDEAASASADAAASAPGTGTSDASDAEASAGASAGASPSPTATGLNVSGMSSGDIVTTIKRALPSQLGVLSPASAENKDALVVTQATAARYDLSSIEDLAEHCADLAFGVPTGFAARSYGTAGLKKLYGCTPRTYREIDDQAELVDRLSDATVKVADVHTASAAIGHDDLVVLDDPQANFIAQQVIPVVRDGKLPSSATAAIDNVSSRLSSEDLTRLDELISGPDALTPEKAASFWLEEGRN